MLSESIDDPASRSRFIELFTKSQPQSGVNSSRDTGSGPVSSHRSLPGGQITGALGLQSGTPLDPAFVDQVAARLAVYLGPIARIVAKNAAQRATNRSDFVALVADSLGTQDRTAFLGELGYRDR